MDPLPTNKLCEEFDLGDYKEQKENKEGVLNKNYVIVTSTGKFFVKSIREKRKADVLDIAAVETFMRDQGIPAICMLPTVSGQKYFKINDDVYTVYPFILKIPRCSAPNS